MDRRAFLKILGLGGVALTLPKPLSLLAPLERPPLHVGRILFPPLGDDVSEFVMDGLSISPAPGIDSFRFHDFVDKWMLRVILHEPERSLNVLQCPTPYVLHLRETRQRAPSVMAGGAIVCGMDQRFDFWLKPGEEPRYPLPEVDLVLQGRLRRKDTKEWMNYSICGKFKTVRLDRAQALKLGVVPAGEPEDDFAADREEEMAKPMEGA